MKNSNPTCLPSISRPEPSPFGDPRNRGRARRWLGLLKPVLLALVLGQVAADPAEPPLVANWIWAKGGDVHGYNQTVVARKTFRVKQPERAVLRITADSFYRVLVNNVIVNDGPARAWPDHYQYDVLDVRLLGATSGDRGFIEFTCAPCLT